MKLTGSSEHGRHSLGLQYRWVPFDSTMNFLNSWLIRKNHGKFSYLSCVKLHAKLEIHLIQRIFTWFCLFGLSRTHLYDKYWSGCVRVHFKQLGGDQSPGVSSSLPTKAKSCRIRVQIVRLHVREGSKCKFLCKTKQVRQNCNHHHSTKTFENPNLRILENLPG